MAALIESELQVKTTRPPTPQEMRALLFAWKVCKHVKSNAIVFANAGQSVSVGAGQMSRVDSVKVAAMKAVLPLKERSLRRTHFFPSRTAWKERLGMASPPRFSRVARYGMRK